MKNEGADFDSVLKKAQELGYAERNPEADVCGYDACRKIAILTSLAYGKQVDFEDIYTEGITEITVEDFKYADVLSATVKIFGTSKLVNGKVQAMVAPVMISKEHPLYAVEDVFNGIYVKGNMLGDVMFYGKGAGSLPTASAVVSDVVEAVKNKDNHLYVEWSSEKQDIVPFSECENRFFVRAKKTDDIENKAKEAFGNVTPVCAGIDGEYAFITDVMTEDAYQKAVGASCDVINMIRVDF